MHPSNSLNHCPKTSLILLQAEYPVALLTEQYRMHPAISIWPSEFFYGGAIEDHAGLKLQRCVPHPRHC